MNFAQFLITIALVILGTVAHVLKKVIEVRAENRDFGIRDYLGLYPYQSALMLMTAIGTAAGLFFAGQLTPVTAFAVGYMAQSVGGVAGKK